MKRPKAGMGCDTAAAIANIAFKHQEKHQAKRPGAFGMGFGTQRESTIQVRFFRAESESVNKLKVVSRHLGIEVGVFAQVKLVIFMGFMKLKVANTWFFFIPNRNHKIIIIIENLQIANLTNVKC